jgi:hypothetical protein
VLTTADVVVTLVPLARGAVATDTPGRRVVVTDAEGLRGRVAAVTLAVRAHVDEALLYMLQRPQREGRLAAGEPLQQRSEAALPQLRVVSRARRGDDRHRRRRQQRLHDAAENSLQLRATSTGASHGSGVVHKTRD